MTRATLVRAGSAVLAAAILAISLVSSLAADAEDIRERSIPDGISGRLFAVDLESVAGEEGSSRTLRLSTPSAEGLATNQALQLLIATYGTNPQLDSARLVVTGTECVFAAPATARLRNNAPLRFVRGAGCGDVREASGELRLVVELASDGRVGVWSRMPDRSLESQEAVFLGWPIPSPAEGRPLLHLRGIDYLPETGLRRIDLLAYVWNVSTSPRWIWAIVWVGSFALVAGLWLLWGAGQHSARGVQWALARGAGAFVATAALAILYAVLTPPFQTPDEPHHIADFANVTGRPQLMEEADAWAARAHVERLRFRANERFRPVDVGQPVEEWETQPAPDASIRGAGVQALWRLAAPLTAGLSAHGTLLALRLANAFWLALAVAAFVVLFGLMSRLPSPHLLAFPLLLVPTVSFFGMHLSNHAPLVGAYVIVAAGVALLVLDPDRADTSGLVMGAGWAAAAALSRSAVPLLAFIAVLAVARLAIAPSRQLRSALLFWAGLILPALLVSSTTVRGYLESAAAIAATVVPAAAGGALDVVARAPWLIALIVILAAGAEWAIARVTAAAGPRLEAVRQRTGRWIALAGAVAVGAILLGSLFVRFPALSRIDRHDRPVAEYAQEALTAGLTILRVRHPDYLTSVTFWGGFGWNETVPPDWFVSLLAGSTGLALLALLIAVGRARDTRRAWLLAAAVAGYALTLSAYAFTLGGQLEIAVDLVGRYVFGLYLSMVVLCWGALALAPFRPWIPLALIAACTGVHAYTLRLIVGRYF